jgi:hypothetical protein
MRAERIWNEKTYISIEKKIVWMSRTKTKSKCKPRLLEYN